MILPTKHIKVERSLVGIGHELLKLLHNDRSISDLWDEFRSEFNQYFPKSPVNYEWFVITLDFLFVMGALQFENGVIKRRIK